MTSMMESGTSALLSVMVYPALRAALVSGSHRMASWASSSCSIWKAVADWSVDTSSKSDRRSSSVVLASSLSSISDGEMPV